MQPRVQSTNPKDHMLDWLVQLRDQAREEGDEDKVLLLERAHPELAKPLPARQTTEQRLQTAAQRLAALRKSRDKLKQQILANAQQAANLLERLEQNVVELASAEQEVEQAAAHAKGAGQMGSDQANPAAVPQWEVFPDLEDEDLQLLDEEAKKEYQAAKQAAATHVGICCFGRCCWRASRRQRCGIPI